MKSAEFTTSRGPRPMSTVCLRRTYRSQPWQHVNSQPYLHNRPKSKSPAAGCPKPRNLRGQRSSTAAVVLRQNIHVRSTCTAISDGPSQGASYCDLEFRLPRGKRKVFDDSGTQGRGCHKMAVILAGRFVESGDATAGLWALGAMTGVLLLPLLSICPSLWPSLSPVG